MLYFYEVTTNLSGTLSQGKHRNFARLMIFHIMNNSISLTQRNAVSLFQKTHLVILPMNLVILVSETDF